MTGKSTHFRTQSPPHYSSASAPAKIPKPAVPWIRINPPHQSPASPPQISLDVILPLHPFKYQTAPLDMPSALRRTPPWYKSHTPPQKTGAVPKPNHSKTKPLHCPAPLRSAGNHSPGLIEQHHIIPCHLVTPSNHHSFATRATGMAAIPPGCYPRIAVLSSCHSKGSSWNGALQEWYHSGVMSFWNVNRSPWYLVDWNGSGLTPFWNHSFLE